MANVLLVNPPIYDFAAFDLWARPLGLLYIAAVLEGEGHQVRIVDCLDRLHPSAAGLTGKNAPRSRRYGTGHYQRRAIEPPQCLAGVPRVYHRFGLAEGIIRDELSSGIAPDLIGVTSGMTYWYPGVVEVTQTLRKLFSGVPIALGGIYATLCPQHALEAVRPDCLVTGAGEGRMLQLAAGADADVDAHEIPFDTLPAPAYHLLGRVEAAAVLTGRGCPFNCDYCSVHALAPRIERRDVDDVTEEISSYAAGGVRDVAFFDDALLWESDCHAKPLFSRLAALGTDVRLHTPNGLHARFIDAEVAGLMRRAGFETLRVSLETVSRERLERWDAKVCYDEFLAAVGHLKAAGFTADEIGAYVMIGAPDESTDEAALSIAAAHAAGVKVRLAQYSAVPGSAMFERAGRSSAFDLNEPLFHNNTLAGWRDGWRWETTQQLKDFAAGLNRRLDGGALVYSTGVVAKGAEGFAAEAGVG